MSPIRLPKASLTIWTDAAPHVADAVTNHGDFFQRTWSNSEQQSHINFLEIRAAQEGVRELAEDRESLQVVHRQYDRCLHQKTRRNTFHVTDAGEHRALVGESELQHYNFFLLIGLLRKKISRQIFCPDTVWFPGIFNSQPGYSAGYVVSFSSSQPWMDLQPGKQLKSLIT